MSWLICGSSTDDDVDVGGFAELRCITSQLFLGSTQCLYPSVHVTMAVSYSQAVPLREEWVARGVEDTRALCGSVPGEWIQ